MIDQHRFIYPDHLGPDQYTRSRTLDRVLNAAIIQANIGEGFEEYLEIFDAFYADDVQVGDETREEPIRGKSKVRSMLLNFLFPLHVMAEVGGLSIFIRETPIPGDVAGETNSAWVLDLVSASGATCTLNWCSCRRWNQSRVVYERHYNSEQKGGPFTSNDFRLTGADPAWFQSPNGVS